MSVSKHSFFNGLFAVVGTIGLIFMYGCSGALAPQSLGPQEPLLQTIEGQAKFSARFQLEEEPQFFYDLFGKELLEGNEVYNYREMKEFDQNGELVVGWTGQLDSERFSAQLDRTVLTEDSFKGRHVEFAIGDDMRIKPSTLFPNRYIIYKTEFDGFRWDLSFSQERHLFTLLNSRISNPVKLSDAAANLAPTLGRRNGLNEDAGMRHIENARLVGFRAQGLLGDVFRVGVTYVNLHKEHPERVENPMMGTVANTPPEQIAIVFRDDSPEDNHAAVFSSFDPAKHADYMKGGVGAAVKSIKVTVTTQEMEEPEPLTPEEIKEGKRPGKPTPRPAETLPAIEVDMSEVVAVPGSKLIEAGDYKLVEGFDMMAYVFDFAKNDIDIHTVKNVEFEMDVAGDYNIVVQGFSKANMNADDPLLAEWIKTADGHIDMPYRDVIQAPGNYGQTSDFQDDRVNQQQNPDMWKDTQKKIRYQFGAARAATLYGIDLEGTVKNVFIRAHYSVNGKFKQYPTVSRNNIGFSRLAVGAEEESDPGYGANVSKDPKTGHVVDANGVRTYADTDGESFEAKLGGSPNDDGEMQREKAWFVNLRQRFEVAQRPLYLEQAVYHVDPGYTTTYRNFGANTDRDQPYSLPRTPESGSEFDPYDEVNYMLIEDDDDDDDWPDDIDFDGVLPQADDRDQNGILDYQEDFLVFEADPPVFDDLIDLNNNGIIDSLEDDYEPEYEYGINRRGYHLTASYDVLDNLTVKAGWLNEREVSSARRNNNRYLHVNYQRDIPSFGTILFQNRFVRVRDDIPDYSITLFIGGQEAESVQDELDYYNARVNTSTLQFLFTQIPGLTLETKFLVRIQKQFSPDDNEAIALDLEETERNERVDFMVPIEQVRADGDKRASTIYPDMGQTPVKLEGGKLAANADADGTGLDHNKENWKSRRYASKTARTQVSILKAKYEIPLGELPYFDKVGEDLTLTPMVKFIWDKAFDRKADEIPKTLNAKVYVPTDPEPVEYLRYNRKSREDIKGFRVDYQFTQRMNVIAGYQNRKFTNRDDSFKNFLEKFPDDEPVPLLYRKHLRTRILELQAINRGEWLGFNIVVLAGFRRTTIMWTPDDPVAKDGYFDADNEPTSVKSRSNTTFVRAMMGF